MGALFLFRSEEQFDQTAVKDIFRDMELGAHKEFNLGGMTLWLYKKQLVDDPNYYHSQTKSAIYVTGALVYRGKSYNESMVSLLQDFEDNSIDVDELIGHYCVVFFKNNKVTIMHDRNNTYHLFTNHNKTIISSSFSAIVKSCLYKLKLNKLAGLEYLTTGYIISPDTYFEGVYLIDKNLEKEINNQYYSFFSYPDFDSDVNFSNLGFQDCVEESLELLQKYWKDIGPLTEQYGAEQGLSGGYDTRLVLLLSRSLPVKISAHTHLAIDKKHLDWECAELLAKEMRLEHKCIPVSPTIDLTSDEAEQIMSENILWHDARTQSELIRSIRTKRYRMEALGDKRLTINGSGGEIYRNYLRMSPGKIVFEDFIKQCIIWREGEFAINDEISKKELVNNIIEKSSKVLEIKKRRYINKLIVRRYYAEIRMAQWHGCKDSYENKLAFHLIPFHEFKITRESYKMLPHTENGGKFEAAMIKSLDMKIASLPNSYGSNFVNESLRNAIKSSILSCMPGTILGFLKKQRLRRANNISPLYSNLNQNVKSVQDAFQTLKDNDFPLDWEKVKVCPTIIYSAMNYGYILNHFS